MNIQHWSKHFAETIRKIYPKPMSPEQRLLAIIRQIADVSGALGKSKGLNLHNPDYKGDVKHMIATVYIDLFVLTEEFNVDLEKEFRKADEWFKQKEVK